MSLVTFGQAELELRCAGTLYWPEPGVMAVSDLHLEKGSSFSLRGFFVPPHDTRDTLSRLEREIAERKPRLLILLGDSFHDKEGYLRLNDDDRAAFEKILRRQQTIWIAGNHDQGFVPDDIESFEDFERDGIVFRHEAKESAGFEVSGHYHPAASLHHKGHRIRGRCFVLSKNRLIMPSFGSYTGGLKVCDPVLRPFIGTDFDVHICSERRVFRFNAAMIEE